MTDAAHNLASRLHCGATYSANKATYIAAMLNADEQADSTNYENGKFVGFTYEADIKGEFGRVAAFHFQEFVGYF